MSSEFYKLVLRKKPFVNDDKNQNLKPAILESKKEKDLIILEWLVMAQTKSHNTDKANKSTLNCG